MKEATLLFEGTIFLEIVPLVNGNSYICPVCTAKIVGKGLHVIGQIANPEVREQKLAQWRYSCDHDSPFPGDEKILRQENIPTLVEVSFFCHDYQCFALFLRNKYPVQSAILPYDFIKKDGIEKYQTQ